MNLPPHPDSSDAEAAPKHQTDHVRNTAATVALWVIVAIVLMVIVLHLTGVVGPLSE